MNKYESIVIIDSPTFNVIRFFAKVSGLMAVILGVTRPEFMTWGGIGQSIFFIVVGTLTAITSSALIVSTHGLHWRHKNWHLGLATLAVLVISFSLGHCGNKYLERTGLLGYVISVFFGFAQLLDAADRTKPISSRYSGMNY